MNDDLDPRDEFSRMNARARARKLYRWITSLVTALATVSAFALVYAGGALLLVLVATWAKYPLWADPLFRLAGWLCYGASVVAALAMFFRVQRLAERHAPPDVE